MQVEITTGENGAATGTKVLLDGVELKQVRSLHFNLRPGGFARLTIQKYATNPEGQVIVDREGAALVSETLVFSGKLEMNGELIGR